MKKFLWGLLACVLLLGIAGVVRADEAGTYWLDSFSDGEMTMHREDIVAAGLAWSITLEAGGVAHVRFDAPHTGTWTDGVITVEADGETEELPYTLDGDSLAVDLDGEIATFRRGDTDSSDDVDNEDDGAALTPLQQWWAGGWYGYWTVSGVTDRYEVLDDGRWDCFAEVTLAADGAGSIRVWDAEDTLFTVDIAVSEAGGAGAMGAAVSEGGSYRDGAAIGRADLIIDPSLYGYEDYMVIDGYHESADDPDEGYYYWVHLRPSGRSWDDMPEDERPPQYADNLDGQGQPSGESPTAEAAPDASLIVDCPDGWLTFGPNLMRDDLEAIPPAVELRKGAETDEDRYKCPGLLVFYEEDRKELTLPPSEVLGDAQAIAPVEIGGRTWQGTAGTWNGDDVAVLRTEDHTDRPIMVYLWFSTYRDSISLTDADVVGIIESIRQ